MTPPKRPDLIAAAMDNESVTRVVESQGQKSCPERLGGELAVQFADRGTVLYGDRTATDMQPGDTIESLREQVRLERLSHEALKAHTGGILTSIERRLSASNQRYMELWDAIFPGACFHGHDSAIALVKGLRKKPETPDDSTGKPA